MKAIFLLVAVAASALPALAQTPIARRNRCCT
jgi:hypothetical protein